MSDERIQPGGEEQRSRGQLEFYDHQKWAAEKHNLLPMLTDVTINALGKEPGDMEEVSSHWEEVIVVREGSRIVGYAGYTAHNISGVGKILYESGKMVAKESQGNGYGGILTKEALVHHTDANYLAFSSQNPAEIQSVRTALDGKKVAPIDISYLENEDLHEALEQIAVRDEKAIDLDTGLRPALYGKRFGNYEVDLSRASVKFIEGKLTQLGFNRDAGDFVFFIARIKAPKESLDYFLNTQNIDETNTQVITDSEIVRTVMNEVGSAENNIVMTMNMAEELSSPLPVAYHELLGRRLGEGVQIARVGFGTSQEAEQIAHTRSFDSTNFTFLHNANATDYQRMILVDGNTLFFRYNGVFYRSTNRDVIERFQQYFRVISQESQGVKITAHQSERRGAKLFRNLRRLWPL